MARKKGTPNKASFQKPGQLKTDFIKIRVSQEWLDTLHQVSDKYFLLKGRSTSDLIRLLVMEGLQRHTYALPESDGPSDREIIQQQIEHL